MTVLKKIVVSNGSSDQFPIGMRVLAVDDNPTCLKYLESLLIKCQYHVTTTNQAIKALEMLRENKDRFDLVISDVHMPDMDGFKLLELVGLEMDLPVIMLSANGETQAVMKGITHGACDYLIKPVRIEELKNIWQHVIRRKKHESRDENTVDSGEDCDKNQLASSANTNMSLDQNVKFNRKRKDQNEEDEDENENEDLSAQKKQRVVWSVELHQKFVAAVHHLGIEKAVPKRILDLMNVERLTRENVASHLQKYRLYLRRISAATNQQANMIAALRGRDDSYLHMNSLDGYSNFNSLIGSNSIPIQSSRSLPRMNNFTGSGFHGFVPSGNQAICTPLEASNRLHGGLSSSGISNNHSCVRIQSLSSDPFEIGNRNGRCTETRRFSNSDISPVNIRPMVSQLAAQNDVLASSQNQVSFNGSSHLLDFRCKGNTNLKWEEQIHVHNQNSNLTYNSSMSTSPNLNNQSIGTTVLAQNFKPDKDISIFDDMKLQNGFDSSGFGLDDLVANAIIKPVSDDFTLLDGEFGASDLFSLGVL